jgi:hypothetical protein
MSPSSSSLNTPIVFLLTASAFYVIGNTFVKLLFIHNIGLVPSRHAFSLNFVLTGLMFTLAFAEVLEKPIVAEATGWVKLVFFSQLVLSLIVCPLALVRSLLADVGIRNAKFGSTLALMVTMGLIVFAARSEGGLWSWGYHTALTCGVGFMGLLTGFAATNTPYNFLTVIFSAKRIKAAKALAHSLGRRERYLLETWCERRRMAAMLQHQPAHERQGQSSGSKVISWFKRSIGSSGGSTSIASLEEEALGIRSVSLSVFLEMDDVILGGDFDVDNPVKRAISATIGILLSLFAVTKVLATVFIIGRAVFTGFYPEARIQVGRTETFVPPVTTAAGESLLHVTSLSPLHNPTTTSNTEKVSVGMHQINVVMSAVLIIMALRGFLLTAFRISTMYMSAISANSTVLFFSLCFGVYSLASFTMLKRSLSPVHRHIVDATGDCDVDAYALFGDCVFVVASVGTLLVHSVILRTLDKEH